jgi:methylated-DNA-protein-cysteine methyltransferase-like protein
MARASIREMFLPDASKQAPRRAGTVKHNPAIQAIWEVVGMIPRGKVSTYGAVARAAGFPGRARLAGRALSLAPKAAHLPWHRVLGAGGRIVFPRSSVQFREQSRRLRAEKVAVKNGRVERSCITDLETFGR